MIFRETQYYNSGTLLKVLTLTVSDATFLYFLCVKLVFKG